MRSLSCLRALSRASLVVAAILIGSGAAVSAPRSQDPSLENTDLVWLDATPDAVGFQWTVDVVNPSGEATELRVILELLDDDDRVVNRDSQGRNTDVATVTLAAGEARQTVRRRGQIAYDLAANVVSYRFRWERPQEPQR